MPSSSSSSSPSSTSFPIRNNSSSSEAEELPFINDSGFGWSRLLVLSAACITLASVFPAGYHLGAMNGPQQVMMEFCNASVLDHYGLVLEPAHLDLVWSSVVSVFLLAGGAGALAGGPLAQRLGRKRALLADALLHAAGAALFAACRPANSVEMLLLGRLVAGLASGMATTLMPLYMTELATKDTAVVAGMLVPCGITSGLLFAQVLSLDQLLGNRLWWPWLLALSGASVLLALLAWPLLPESPRFLFVVKGKTAAAIRELCRLRDTTADRLVHEVNRLHAEAGADRCASKPAAEEKHLEATQGKWSIGRVWNTPSLRTPFLCTIVFHVGNQFSGINAVFYYSTSIFESSGLNKTQAELALLGAGLANCLMSCTSVFFTLRFRRRPLMLTSVAGCVVFLVALTTSITFIDRGRWVGYVSMVALVAYVVVFAVGVGSLPFFLPTELIPAGPRAAVISLGTMVNWACNFCVALAFPTVQSLIGVYSFLIFAGCMLLMGMFTFFYLPETFRRTPSNASAC